MATATAIAGTGASVSTGSGGTKPWGNPGGITADDSSYASTAGVFYTTEGSYFLRATNFGFSIPSGATINGITATIRANASYYDGFAGDYVYVTSVVLLKGGTRGGSDLSDSADIISSEASYVYGATNTLWGNTWSASDINSSNFGLDFQVVLVDTNGQGAYPFVDYIQLSIDYTPAAASTNANMLMVF